MLKALSSGDNGGAEGKEERGCTDEGGVSETRGPGKLTKEVPVAETSRWTDVREAFLS